MKNGDEPAHVTDVGPGDWVKVAGEWKQILSNSAHGSVVTPRKWTVITTDGGVYGMYDIQLYRRD